MTPEERDHGSRRGAPPIANILDVLRAKPSLRHLYDEVIEDAKAALAAARDAS